MSTEHETPPSLPVDSQDRPVKRRAIFSSDFPQLTEHHARSPQDQVVPHARKHHHDDSLQLIDDLVNRPMDMLYKDSRLVNRPKSKITLWGTRVFVMLICAVVGFSGSQFVRLLNTDPRKEVRDSLARQLIENNKEIESLNKDITSLRKNIDSQSNSLTLSEAQLRVRQDDMMSGTLPVEGEGITLTLANPVAASGDIDGSTPRESSGNKVRTITDIDLQQWVSLFWQSGAEAVAINGNRLGALTSIRTAGNSILVGSSPIQSPYKIQAIGDKNKLAEALGERALPNLYKDYHHAGVYPQISKESNIKLNATSTGNITDARRLE